jgi:dCMP deaminase
MGMSGSLKKHDEWLLGLATYVATGSKDPSTQVGSVAVDSGRRPLSWGWNGFARGIADTKERLHNRDTKIRLMVHSEMNCLLNAAYNGVSLKGATLYVSGLPVCEFCASPIIQAGIKRVVMGHVNPESYERWKKSTDAALELFREAGVEWYFV